MGILSAFLSYVPFWGFMIALITSLFDRKNSFGKTFTSLLLLLAVGVGELWWCAHELFFAAEAAQTWGWKESTFQQQLALADVTIALGGIFAFLRKEFHYSLGIGLIAMIFIFGVALLHLTNFILNKSWVPGHSIASIPTSTLITLGLILGLFLWRRELQGER